ncbi:TIGR04104 family putative zinc finger protein [Lentibacillus sediminis]|uniref:TIGR04104 family putative zinc finger protein n=1 Tax=Lentibacillus sediminis TaxID=1940529 RepID=UPI003B8463C7
MGVVLQKCQNCNVSFSWSVVYKSFWGLRGYKPIECDNCCAKHKITIPGRLTFVALTMLPMLVLTNFINFYTSLNNIIATLGIGLAILFIGSLFTPYLVRFKVV